MFYQVAEPLRAIMHRPRGEDLSVTIPAGAVLTCCGHTTRGLLGMIEVRWQTREYSVLDRDLHRAQRGMHGRLGEGGQLAAVLRAARGDLRADVDLQHQAAQSRDPAISRSCLVGSPVRQG